MNSEEFMPVETRAQTVKMVEQVKQIIDRKNGREDGHKEQRNQGRDGRKKQGNEREIGDKNGKNGRKNGKMNQKMTQQSK